ncbi:hydrogenase nickel incorporation protein HypB [Geomonas oryzae]|uniref:hydrogenase nickel incorporation protein HypB n=1 Tax=Geomonas oryzae TaxID=2364273 RepID=UPI00100BFAB4|nr:hydrogenase nickel incorporation protein HypB [Geomonas oryzae]
MCVDCGCGPTHKHDHDHDHDHDHHDHDHHDHGHHHDHDNGHHGHDHHHGHKHHHHHEEAAEKPAKKVVIETDILAKNNRMAAGNRELFRAKGLFVLNLVSSPGSGKTTILERSLKDLAGSCRCAVVEGDQQTDNDAVRIAATGVPVKQVNTGAGCHLDAHMVLHAVEHFDLDNLDLLLIENVGNLVCPASFDLGEHHKVVVLSVTEGEDKPLKYPQMFHAADIMLLNKVDLLPHLDFDVEKCKEMARRVSPGIRIFEVSSRTGEGMDQWYGWLKEGMEKARG